MKILTQIGLLLLGFFYFGSTLAQPVLNERYRFNEETKAIFGSIVVTDTCYYIAGLNNTSALVSERKSGFVKMDFDGNLKEFTSIENDTMGIDLWQGHNLIPTLDGNFAYMALTFGDNSENAFMFLKIAPNGDTILTNYIYDFYEENEEFGIRPLTLIQDSDSTYYGILRVQRETDLLAGTLYYRLDKNGNLIFHTTFYPSGYYQALSARSMSSYSDSTFIIGSTMRKSSGDPEEVRYFSKLLLVDTLGNLIESHELLDDSLVLDCNGLTRTSDGGLLYCGRKGKVNLEYDIIGFRAEIKKLNADFEKEWTINIGSGSTGFAFIGLTKILQTSATEYVAVGHMTEYVEPDFKHYGWLIKFNINGELLWERRYVKVPKFNGETNSPKHELYDVELTPDGGFVMVGQSVNYHENSEPFGQMGWLVKTNRFGCIVPNCQIKDVQQVIKPKDTSHVVPPKEEPITWLYPNPATDVIYYYHHQDNFNYGTAYIYNTNGQLVQKWEITANDVTYEVDVSEFAPGNYVLKVFNLLGEEIQTERFVKLE